MDTGDDDAIAWVLRVMRMALLRSVRMVRVERVADVIGDRKRGESSNNRCKRIYGSANGWMDDSIIIIIIMYDYRLCLWDYIIYNLEWLMKVFVQYDGKAGQ